MAVVSTAIRPLTRLLLAERSDGAYLGQRRTHPPLPLERRRSKFPTPADTEADSTHEWRSRAFMEDFVASENVVGVFPGAHVDEPQLGRRRARKDRDSFA